jgi:protein XRP2
MGNICHSGPVLRSDAPPPRPPPSSSPRESLTFGRDPALKREDYIFSNARGPSCLIKQPGSINGQQFLLDGCADCDIFLLDNCTAVQIDDCTNCRIVVGPCDSSLFVRNCTNCTIVAAVQQFRTRDCDALDVFLYSVTEPVLELSTNVRVACFPLTYFSLQQQFDRAGFSVWNNRWSEVLNIRL